MTPLVGFFFFLSATVVLLLGVLWSGFAARRALHFALVIAAVVGLALSIAYATRLGKLYDLEVAGWITPFHLGLAKVATAAYLLPVISGIALLKNPAARTWHRRIAFLVLGLTVVTLITGAWMLAASERLPN